MSSIINLFKKGVPSQKKVYSKLRENRNDLIDLSYKQFKRRNVELPELKEEFLSMNRYNYLSNSEIYNIFKYLSRNLVYDKYTTLKKLIDTLNETKDAVIEKRKTLTDMQDTALANSLDIITSHILMLKNKIASSFDFDIIELENAIKFEFVVKKILKPNNYKEYNIVWNILENLEILSYHDIKNRTFSEILYNQILHAKLVNNIEQLDYYRSLLTYINNIKTINIEPEVYELLNMNFDIKYDKKSMLNEKIYNLNVDERTGRYLINDFIVSIDNDNTVKIDDALSIEKTSIGTYLVGIHITDVYSLGIFANELLSCERTKEHVSKIKGSLIEFQKKNCISLFLEIDNNGVVLNHKLLLTKLEVDRNLIYDDVSKIIVQNPDSVLSKTIINLTDLYNMLDNVKFPLYPNLNTLPHLIVNKLMVLYGCVVSDEFYKKDVPGLHLSGKDHDNVYTIDKATYDTGFKDYMTYSKTTKPLYDQSSVLCQYIMHRCIFGRINQVQKEELTLRMEKVADQLNRKSKS